MIVLLVTGSGLKDWRNGSLLRRAAVLEADGIVPDLLPHGVRGIDYSGEHGEGGLLVGLGGGHGQGGEVEKIDELHDDGSGAESLESVCLLSCEVFE